MLPERMSTYVSPTSNPEGTTSGGGPSADQTRPVAVCATVTGLPLPTARTTVGPSGETTAAPTTTGLLRRIGVISGHRRFYAHGPRVQLRAYIFGAGQQH